MMLNSYSYVCGHRHAYKLCLVVYYDPQRIVLGSYEYLTSSLLYKLRLFFGQCMHILPFSAEYTHHNCCFNLLERTQWICFVPCSDCPQTVSLLTLISCSFYLYFLVLHTTNFFTARLAVQICMAAVVQSLPALSLRTCFNFSLGCGVGNSRTRDCQLG